MKPASSPTGRLFGMPIRTNLDGYYTDYHDIQILVSLPNVTIATATGGGTCDPGGLQRQSTASSVTNDNVTLNAKTAHIYGAEWDITR